MVRAGSLPRRKTIFAVTNVTIQRNSLEKQRQGVLAECDISAKTCRNRSQRVTNVTSRNVILPVPNVPSVRKAQSKHGKTVTRVGGFSDAGSPMGPLGPQRSPWRYPPQR